MVMLITLVHHARVPPFNCGQHLGGLSPTPLFILGGQRACAPRGMATKVSGRAAVSVSHTNSSIAVNPSERLGGVTLSLSTFPFLPSALSPSQYHFLLSSWRLERKEGSFLAS